MCNRVSHIVLVVVVVVEMSII